MSCGKQNIRAVLFDLDDTLYDRSAAFRRWAAGFVTDTLGIDEATPQFLETIAWLIEHDNSGYGNKPALFADIQRRYPTVTGTTNELVGAFHTGLVKAMIRDEDAYAVVCRLHAEGVPFGIITNGSHRQREKIERLEIHHLTDCIFISEPFGAKKPHPSIFRAAAQHLGVTPSHILFVGDHCENDVVGARRVGMRTAWLCQGNTWPHDLVEHAPDWYLNSLTDLIPILFNPSGNEGPNA